MNEEKTIKQEITIAINNILSSKKGKKYASLQEIYNEVSKNKGIERDEVLEAQIRARLQEHCSQYKNYLGKEDLFETKAINSGLWKNKITGENEIRKYVFEIIQKFPGIDITNLQKTLLDTIKNELTEADKMESKTRPGEMKIEQIIRNFVSHKESYKNTIDFISDGNATRLYLKSDTDNIEESEEAKTDSHIDEKIESILNYEDEEPTMNEQDTILDMGYDIPKPRKKNKNNNKVYIRKSDFETYLKEYKKKLDNGYSGEALVYDFEKERLKKLGREDLAKKVKWISRDDGDGFGYDIKSFEITNDEVTKIYIEVKSTTSSLNSDFEMSANEVKFARKHKDNYRLYRICKKGNKTQGYIVKKPLDEEFDFKPSSYRVSIKNK